MFQAQKKRKKEETERKKEKKRRKKKEFVFQAMRWPGCAAWLAWRSLLQAERALYKLNIAKPDWLDGKSAGVGQHPSQAPRPRRC